MIRLDPALIVDLCARSRQSARLRAHHNLHPTLADPIQRVVMAVQPGSYVRPHRHRDGIWELFALLRGRVALLMFDHAGRVIDRTELAPGGTSGAQFPPRVWHALAALEPDTVLMEVKPGPYVAETDKEFAAWAPAEGDAAAAELAWRLAGASAGDLLS